MADAWTMGEMNIATIDGFRVNRIPISAGGRAIASVWCGSVGREWVGGPAEGLAHAQLIAAAPAVADAARAMLAALHAVETWAASVRPSSHLDQLGAALEKVSAAVAQARASGIEEA